MVELPISIDVLRLALKVEVADDDAELSRLAVAAGTHIERYTGLRLRSATRTQYLRAWERTILTEAPLVSITSIAYTDTTGNPQTLAATEYWIDKSQPMWALMFDSPDPFKETTQPLVTYVAGYTQVPGDLQHAIVALVGAWYANPEALTVASMQVLPKSFEYLLANYSTKGPFS